MLSILSLLLRPLALLLRLYSKNWLLRELKRRDPTFRPPPIVDVPEERSDRLGRSGKGGWEEGVVKEPAYCRFCGESGHTVEACPLEQEEDPPEADNCPKCGRSIDQGSMCPVCKLSEENETTQAQPEGKDTPHWTNKF